MVRLTNLFLFCRLPG